ncbi:MAG: polymer-forming cytoskeletal protein [Glaciimonas sp.]|nr:polymer-forming cytoskeletal protein [Glaciimonas sp.]NMM37055.1 polymer-forming cytoskeletal protein [Glaciimonas sp.]
MFKRKPSNTIDCLIGVTTTIEGDVHFTGGLRIDGKINGDVIAEPGAVSMLVVSELARITGEVRAAHLVINGEIIGAVHSAELLELQPKARITGDVFYKTLEMHGGALVAGRLTHGQPAEEPVLKLAVSKA